MVMGRTFEEHLRNLQEVFDRFRANNLALNPKKCQLFQKSVKFLCHIVSTEGIRTSDDKIFAIKNRPEPRDKHELWSFLGLCTYYRRFVEGYADIAALLHRLTEARASFHWKEECEKAFRALKRSLCSSPILAYPQPETNFILDTDASNLGIGAVLSQVQDEDERVIEFFSRVQTKAERNYCATRKELLAIVKAVEHFHKYLYGQNFLIRTDHAALTWLLRMKNPEGQVARWLEKLQQYHFQIKHRLGRKHNNADALSRRPCGDCKHCERIDEHEVTSSKTTMVPSNDWTAESCRTIQQQDPNIGPILEWKERGNERPSWEVISDKSPELKTLWPQWDSLSIDNGLLKRIWESADGRSKTMQLVVPKVQVPNVLREIHDGVSGAHFGINKTLKKVRERFYWVYYHEDVERWSKKCYRCAASKGPKTRFRGVMREYNMGAPFERIAIDVAGPFPVTEGGNKYILVAMDYFTKWPEAYAIPNQEATTVAKVLMDNLICRFGVPLELHSDQGRNFEVGMFQELCRLLGIRKTRTTPLHPQSDGMVERFNKTMEEHLSKVVEQHQRDWYVRLPPFLMAYRAAIHETTGQTPAKIMFGRELRLPCDLEFGSPGEPPTEVTDYVNNLRSILLETLELVRAKIRTASHRMKTRYDQRANHDGFRQIDLIYGITMATAKSAVASSSLSLTSLADQNPQSTSSSSQLQTEKSSYMTQAGNQYAKTFTQRSNFSQEELRKFDLERKATYEKRSLTTKSTIQFVSLPDCTAEEHLDGIAKIIGRTGIHSVGKINGQAIVSLAGVEQAEMLINTGFQVKDKTIYPYPLFNIPKKYILSGVMLFIPDEDIVKVLQPYGQVLSIRPLPFPTSNPLYKHLSSLRREIVIKKKEDTAMPAIITIEYMSNNFKIFVAEDVICAGCKRHGHIRAKCPFDPRIRETVTKSFADALNPTAPPQTPTPEQPPMEKDIPTAKETETSARKRHHALSPKRRTKPVPSGGDDVRPSKKKRTLEASRNEKKRSNVEREDGKRMKSACTGYETDTGGAYSPTWTELEETMSSEDETHATKPPISKIILRRNSGLSTTSIVSMTPAQLANQIINTKREGTQDGRMSLEATNLVWAGSPHRAEHEPGNLGSDNQAVAELSAETHFQEENSRIANASGNYANLPIDRKHANFAAACVADVTPSTSGALTAATNWAEQMEASETDEDGFTVVKHKRRRRESPSRPVEQRSSGVATSRRTGPTPRRRPPAGGATGVQMIRATRADIADARARQRSSTEDNCVFVEHCPDFGSTHYLQAVEELVGGAGNVLQVMKMDGHMLVGLSTKALAERLIRDGLDIGHTHLRAFPFKKRAERITVGNLPFFVNDAAVIEALKPYGDVTSIVPIRLRAGRCGRQGHRRANCPIIPGRASNNAQPQPAPPPSGASSTESRQLNRPTPTAPAPSPKRPAPQTSAPGTSAALPARTSSDAVAPFSEPMEIAAEVLAPSTSNSSPQAVKPMEAPEAPTDLRPPASQPAGVVPQAQPASVAPPGPLHAHGTPVPPSPSSSGRKTRPDLEAYLKRNPGVSFAETDALGLGREEVLDILSSKTRAHKRGQHLTLPQSNALAGLIYQILDLRPGGDSNIYKVLQQVLSELRTAPTAVPSTPPLPAPRPAGPTPPVPHEEETTPTAMRPSPPLEPTIEDDMIVEIFTKLDHTTSLRPIYEAGINPVVLRNAVLYADMPSSASPGTSRSAGQEHGRPSIPSPTGGKKLQKDEIQKTILRENSENRNNANPPAGVKDVNLAAARDVTLSLPAGTSFNGAARALGNWADCIEDLGPEADDAFTVVKGKKRRRESTNSPTAAAPSSNIGDARTSRRPQSSAGSVPRAQEVRTTRAHITEARARQASSSEDHCVYLEHGPELQPFHYLRALDRMLGGTAGVIQVSKVNGHQLLGLANRGLAERFINEGLEVEGTLLRAFPFRKRAERITVGNLPFFVEDSAIISALKPYGRVTSIAPKLMKAGPYTYNDGRREAFIVLREGMTTERLPTRLEIPIKGEAWPAYLSSGIKCSRCHGQGHRRANCPLLAGRANNSRLAPPTSPAGVPSTPTSAPPQRSAAQPPAPAPSSTAMEIPGTSHAARAISPSTAPRSSPPVAPAVPTEMAPPAPPPVTPAPSLRAPGSHEPAVPTLDIEISE
ncbi:K02A2.6-like, partial [Cordylochernes scorpioides]